MGDMGASTAGMFAGWPDERAESWLPLPDRSWPPSKKLLYAVLVEEGPTTANEIKATAGLSPGSVYPGLHELEEEGLAVSRCTVGGNERVWQANGG